MSEEKLVVYARKNRAKKWGTTYHVHRNCPMIKNRPDIEGVELDVISKDVKDRKKELTLCKMCSKMSEEKAKAKDEKKADSKAEKDAKKEDPKSKDDKKGKETATA